MVIAKNKDGVCVCVGEGFEDCRGTHSYAPG